ncbi:hypothetical protein [Nocardiopsis halotolerans]|uniref:hypothetical protein n=1 Tax=Nocardiopsis halotolerans TaxID=124252 RepID=UPI00034B0F54|nr:hypothetical protein [Nocardiopsis halotolerans]
MDTSRDETVIGPSGICRRGQHDWRHDPPGAKRQVCTRCRSMSTTNYCDCAECASGDAEK